MDALAWTEACDTAVRLLLDLELTVCVAAEVAGRPLRDPWTLPASRQPFADPRCPYQVFFQISNFWLISAYGDHRAARVAEAVKHITAVRAPAGHRCVHVGPASGTCFTQAILETAKGVTHVSQQFGCGPLVEIVRQQCTPEVEDEVWAFPDAVIWYYAGLVEGFPETWRGLLAERWSQRMEFLRRLFSCDLAGAFRAAQPRDFCDWLERTFRDVDFGALRRELELEFAAIAPPSALAERKDDARLTFDLSNNSVTLDGTPYNGLEPQPVRVLHVIARAAPKKIDRVAIGAQTGASRPDRELDKLPPELNQLVSRGKGRGGYLLVLPAIPSDISW
jgi:hypothetical protein